MHQPLPTLTSDEAAYSDRTWEQIASLLRAHVQLGPAEWARLRDRTLLEIHQRIALARSLGRTPEQLDQEAVDDLNAKLVQERKILLRGYILAWKDFLEIFVPIMKTFSVFPDLSGKACSGRSVLELVYEVAQSDYRTASGAYDELIGTCDAYVVRAISQKMRRDFENLRKGSMAKHSFVMATDTRKCCERCQNLDGEYLDINGLLGQYMRGAIGFPHQLESEEDELHWCSGPYLLNVPDDLWNLRKRTGEN